MFEKALGNLVGTGRKIIDETEQINDCFYAQVMDELSEGYKDKALVGKAIAQSNGNEAKFDSIYIKLRAKSLQDTYQLTTKIINTKAISQQNKLSKIKEKYQNGYFHDLYRDEIKQLGFTSPWYAPNRLFCRTYLHFVATYLYSLFQSAPLHQKSAPYRKALCP
jgi:hypothetical protein